MSSIVRRSVFALCLVVPAASCSTATPVLVEGAKLAPLPGRANTSGYAGEITTDNRQCRGSYTGSIGQTAVPFEMSCRDGRSGVGTARLREGYFVSGEVRLSDGTLMTVRSNGETFP